MPRGSAMRGRWAVGTRAVGRDMSAADPGEPVGGPRPAPQAAPRPAPQYGEYATPEQQRAAIREPAPVVEPQAARAPAGAPASGPGAPGAGDAASIRPGRAVDRIVTFAMLAYGLVTVVSAFGQLWDFSQFAQSWLNLAGVDATFTNTAQGDLWGRIGAVAFALGWILTAGFAWRSLRGGRVSWWIPVVGAVVTFLVVSVCLTVPLLGDPAVAAAFGA